jgi:hypothetical protein
MREKYAAISARKIFSHIFHSFSLFSLFLFVCDKYCHFVSLTWWEKKWWGTWPGITDMGCGAWQFGGVRVHFTYSCAL